MAVDTMLVDFETQLTDDFETFLISFMKFSLCSMVFLCEIILFRPLMPIKCDFLHAKLRWSQRIKPHDYLYALLMNDCMREHG